MTRLAWIGAGVVWLGLVGGLLHLHLGANEGARQDLGYCRRILTPVPAAGYSFDLPEDFYSLGSGPNLPDLIILDSIGQAQPSMISEQPIFKKPNKFEPPLPMVWVISPKGKRIEEGTYKTALMQSHPKPGASQAGAHFGSQGVLLQCPEAFGACAGLRLEWERPKQDFAAVCRLFASQDAQSWSLVTASAGAMQQMISGREIIKNEFFFKLPPATRFLLLKWPLKQLPPLTAVFPLHESQNLSAQLRWVIPELKRAKPGFFLYHMAGSFPVRAALWELPQSGSSLEWECFSREHFWTHWYVQARGTLFSNTIDGYRLQSAPLFFAPVRERAWAVRIAHNSDLMGSQVPELQLGFAPDRISFLNRGQGPYRLLYAKHLAGDRRLRQSAERLRLEDTSLKMEEAFLESPEPYTGKIGPDPVWPKFYWLLGYLGLLAILANAILHLRQRRLMNNH